MKLFIALLISMSTSFASQTLTKPTIAVKKKVDFHMHEKWQNVLDTHLIRRGNQTFFNYKALKNV